MGNFFWGFSRPRGLILCKSSFVIALVQVPCNLYWTNSIDRCFATDFVIFENDFFPILKISSQGPVNTNGNMGPEKKRWPASAEISYSPVEFAIQNSV